MVQDEHQSGKAPLSAHPAFPAIVGLWFAALLGMGTMVMPAAVLEKIASATGFASILPLVEAPLSAAGRAVFALLATIIGLVGGLVLARRVAGAHDGARPTRRRNVGRAAPPRPLSVHDDLGEDAIAPPAAVSGQAPTRRRALTVTEDAAPSAYLMAAPLPGEAEIPELVEDEMPVEPEIETQAEIQPGELDLSELTLPDDTQPALADEMPAEDFAMPAYVPELDTRKPRAVTAPSVTEFVAQTSREADGGPIDPFTAPIVAAPIDRALDDLGMVQLAERLGRSLQQRLAAREAESEAQVEAEPIASSAPAFDDQGEMLAVPPPVVPDALRAFMDAAPETLSPAAEIDLDADGDAEPASEIQVPPPVVPAALMPFAFAPFDTDEEEDEFEPALFTLPLSTMAPRPLDTPVEAADPVEASVDEDDDSDEQLALDENYSSLLEMGNPFRQREEFVRIDEPEAEDDDIEPAVVFPAQEMPVPQPEAVDAAEAWDEDDAIDAAPVHERPFDAPRGHQPAPNTAPARPRPARDAAETERALRSALANLQRMSGAA